MHARSRGLDASEKKKLDHKKQLKSLQPVNKPTHHELVVCIINHDILDG